jgi:hypothetical protein
MYRPSTCKVRLRPEVSYLKHLFTIVIVVFCLVWTSVLFASPVSQVTLAEVQTSLESMPPAFTQNMGQWDEQVLFQADLGGATMWITVDGVYYQFARRYAGSDSSVQVLERNSVADSLETLVLKTSIVGASADAVASGDSLLDYRCNYFLGNDSSRWRSNVASYRSVVLHEVYSGIDLTYYGRDGRLEYDFRVSAGADYSQIRIEYEGAESVLVAADGALVVSTDWGELHELAPVVFQEVNGVRRPVTAEYRMMGQRTFGFHLGPDFDSSLPVVIDPVLVYSTYLGGGINDGGRSIVVDESGAVYVAGETFSSNFPTMNPYESSRKGYLSAIVSKLSKSGNALIYSTYLGGSITDASYSVAVNSQGEAYVVGFTSSTDFPIAGAVQGSFGGGNSDAFLTKLSSGGDHLIWSTYLGGSGWDSGEDVALDTGGDAYVTGFTYSTNFLTHDAYRDTNTGDYDAFVTKITRNGSMVYSTYLGGSSDDKGSAVVVNAAGEAYVTGRTRSNDFPSFQAYQGLLQGVYLDAFISILSPTGDSLIYSTFLGGDKDDYAYDIAVDSSGDAYITGRTLSDNFPVANAEQSTNHGEYDVFVTRLSLAANALVYSTYLGGTVDDYGYAIVVDGLGAAYVAGRAFSADFPTVNAYQGSYQGGYSDAFVVKLSGAGAPVFSTYLGGSAYDGAYGIDIDTSGAAYVTGFTDSDNFPTRNPYQATWNSDGADLFVAKLVDMTGCCHGRVGDTNGFGGDVPTIGDVSNLINFLFITNDLTVIPCLAEADVNQSGGPDPQPEDITIGDISTLIDYLFISGPTVKILPNCL